MSDLSEFLLARIAEDEDRAQCIVIGEGQDIPLYHEGRMLFRSGSVEASEDQWREFATKAGALRVDDPRLLAECEAKRTLVDMGGNECGTQHDDESAAEFERIYGSPAQRHYPADFAAGCDGCSAAESCDADHDRVLRVLAVVYADHPDYRQEWKP